MDWAIVAAGPAGQPVAYGMCEALRAKSVYWAEKEDEKPMRFRQFLQQEPGEDVVAFAARLKPVADHRFRFAALMARRPGGVTVSGVDEVESRGHKRIEQPKGSGLIRGPAEDIPTERQRC